MRSWCRVSVLELIHTVCIPFGRDSAHRLASLAHSHDRMCRKEARHEIDVAHRGLLPLRAACLWWTVTAPSDVPQQVAPASASPADVADIASDSYAPVMGVPEKIAALAARLPPAKQAEVLEFVEFLASRLAARSAAPGREVAAWSDAAFHELALQSLAADEDPVTYELADCKETR